MIKGIQKLSLLDYPEEPAFVIFLGGCNFKCPFCHNKDIVNNLGDDYEIEEILSMIEVRKVLIGAVVVTGGEPTIHGQNLISLLQRLRSLNLKIKLDTNGTNPDLITEIINQNLIDYIAMDLKSTFSKYNETTGSTVSLTDIKKSIEVIKNSGLAHQFRTTVNKTMHTKEDIEEILSYVGSNYIIQPYKYSEHQLVDKNYGEFIEEELKEISDNLKVSV